MAKTTALAAALACVALEAASAEPHPAEAAAQSIPSLPRLTIRCEPGLPVQGAGLVAIGGIDQWVTISGADCANPVILFLHGGPGNPLSPFGEAIYGRWKDKFTLVHWDQRGAGLTYLANPPPDSLSVDGMVADGLLVAEHLRETTGQKKLILVGGSWGTVLGIRMAHARPDLFHAYIGAGQLVSGPENQAASYREALARARAAGDEPTAATLEALGPPPWTDPRNPGILRRATRKIERAATLPPPEGWWLPAAEYASAEIEAAHEAGDDFSYIQFVGLKGDGMMSAIDLRQLGPDFEIPLFFVHGEHDLVTVPDVAQRYFDLLQAPQKSFRLLEKTGHDPNAALIDAEYDILSTQVLPLVKRARDDR